MKETDVTFKNTIWNISATLFLPNNFDENRRYPAVVLSHPGGGVKEQTSRTYAMGLAEAGYVALTFDASHQGASEGEPRLVKVGTARRLLSNRLHCSMKLPSSVQPKQMAHRCAMATLCLRPMK